MHNNKPKALIILSPGFPANEEDSTCIPPQQIFVKALKDVDPELNIIVLTFQYPFFSKQYEWNGIKVISFGNPKNSKHLHRLTGLRVSLILKQLNKNYQIKGLLSFWLGKCALVGDRFAKKYQLKHYTWLLGQDAKSGNKYFYKVNPAGDSLIAISDFIASGLNKNYSVLPQHIIPVGIDIASFSADNKEKGIDIIGVGSLIPLKQYSVFLEVIAILVEYLPNIKAVICGDGPEMNRLRAITDSLNLQHNVTFTGTQSHEAILTLMQQSKILLHTSNYEGFSTVCLEALYAGAQVVSFIQPMNAAIENWHIVTDKENMVRLLKSILQNTELEYSSVLPYTVQDSAREIAGLFD